MEQRGFITDVALWGLECVHGLGGFICVITSKAAVLLATSACAASCARASFFSLYFDSLFAFLGRDCVDSAR